jgi:HemY protein
MIRVFIFLALLLAAALGLAWLADRPGTVALNWQNRIYEVDIITAVLAISVLALALSVGWSLLRTFVRLPGIMSAAGRNRRKARGYQAVARGMVAVSAGDARLAQRQANDAERLLGREPLTLLLAAQSAQLAGDSDKAEKAFGSMLEDADTKIVGLRGLHMEAQRNGQADAARFYAEEAYKLSPGSEWASAAVLSQRCAERDWLGAMALVEQAASRRILTKEAARKQRAVLLTADALDRAGVDVEGAYRAAQEAVRLDPALPPASALLGRRMSERGEYGKASKVLEAAWSAEPHPDVAEAYLDVRLGDSALDRLKRARTLLRLTPAHPESRLTMARAALDAREFAVARENLETLVLEAPTVRACVLMAELEEQDGGNLGLVREWLARASRAQRDKAWVAEGKVSETWLPVSPSGKVGGYTWTTPPQAAGSLLLEEMAHRPAAIAPTMPAQTAAPAPASGLVTADAAPLAVSRDIVDVPAAQQRVAIETSAPPDDPGPDAVRPKSGWKLFARHN